MIKCKLIYGLIGQSKMHWQYTWFVPKSSQKETWMYHYIMEAKSLLSYYIHSACCHKHEKSCNWKPLLFIGFTISTGVAIRVATVVEFLDLLSWLLTYLLKSAGFTHTILPIAWVNLLINSAFAAFFVHFLPCWIENSAAQRYFFTFLHEFNQEISYINDHQIIQELFTMWGKFWL